MPNPTDNPQAATHATFRDAFCAIEHCSPGDFDSKVFSRSLYRHAVPLSWILRLVWPSYFSIDREFVRQFGIASTTRDVDRAAGDFSGDCRRVHGVAGILRNVLRIRASGTRLTAIHNSLVPHITPQAHDTKFDVIPRASAPGASRPQSPSSPRPAAPEGIRGESSWVTLRKLRQAHDEITQGRPSELVLSQLGISAEELIQLLDENASGNPPFAWLASYLRSETRLAALEAENSRLTRTVASLSMEMNRIQERAVASTKLPA